MLRKITPRVLNQSKQNTHGGTSPRATPTTAKPTNFHPASKPAAGQMLADTTAMATHDHTLQHLQLPNEDQSVKLPGGKIRLQHSSRRATHIAYSSQRVKAMKQFYK